MNRQSLTNLVICASGAAVCAAPFEIARSTIDGGGIVRSTGEQFELSGTIGQPDAGTMSGGGFELAGGFWFPLDPGDCNEDGIVGLFDHGTFAPCLTGPGAPTAAECGCFDVNGSGTVDLDDFARIQTTFAREQP